MTKQNPRTARDLIYGDPGNGTLVFMERSKALETAAFRSARTWGEFRRGAPALFKWAIEWLKEEAEEEGDNEWIGPDDDDELDPNAIPGFSEGDYPYFPEQLMLDFIPEGIRRRFGKVESTVLNGPMLSLEAGHEIEIVAGLRKEGFSCQRDDGLLKSVYS